MYTYQAKVIKIIDGDTLDLDIDLGFGVHRHQRIRLSNIDTPELRNSDPLIKEAAKVAKIYLEQLLPIGVMVKLNSTEYEKYGRALGKIWTLDKDLQPQIEINSELVRLGYAKAYLKQDFQTINIIAQFKDDNND